MRLIQAGSYRIVISAMSRESQNLATSNFAPLGVRAKPVVESARVMPVAFGMPALLILAIAVRRWRR